MTRSANRIIIIFGACAFYAGALPSYASDEVYQKMANDIAKYSKTNKVKNLAVLSFSRRARTSREESEYISEKLLACLVESGKVNLLERTQLDKVLEERRLASSGVTEEPEEGTQKKIDPSDVIIVGTIFGTKDHLKIIAKMIDPLTGAVLHTVQAQTERQWEIIPQGVEFEFDVPDLGDVAAMFGEQNLRPAFVDFRDAPSSGLDTESCNARRTRLAALQAEALDAKAKYWALQMRDPAFRSSSLRRNPGGEIQDPERRKVFYSLVSVYFRAKEPPLLGAAELNAVIKLMGEETKVSDDCGLH
ncbi:MAG TPA: hypothetical protein DCZ92_07435 [Elusimicrobia bacterium]|nr:hypothetical protein [Elusimicrobiota bacterium]